jgi:polyisoprenoid-binding protein YceI
MKAMNGKDERRFLMRLHQLFLNALKPKVAIAVAFSILGFLAPNLAAQQQSFHVVPDHSTARIFVGSPNNPTFFNVGVTRVSGELNLDPNDPQTSTFNFTLYAANEKDAANADAQAQAGDQPVISFQSQHVVERGDGTLRVDGQLTVTEIEQTATASAGEDYSGPAYVTTGLKHSVHEASFIFSPLAAESAPDSSPEPSNVRLLTAQQTQPESAMLLTATASVNGEAFPELLSSVEGASWPTVVNDEKCTTSSSIGEDYSGPSCTGNVIDAFPSPEQPLQAGEDYSGPQLIAPQGEQVTIHLGLDLTSADGNAGLGQDRPDAMGKALVDVIQSFQAW